jgi:hypothetical protein
LRFVAAGLVPNASARASTPRVGSLCAGCRSGTTRPWIRPLRWRSRPRPRLPLQETAALVWSAQAAPGRRRRSSAAAAKKRRRHPRPAQESSAMRTRVVPRRRRRLPPPHPSCRWADGRCGPRHRAAAAGAGCAACRLGDLEWDHEADGEEQWKQQSVHGARHRSSERCSAARCAS